MSNEEAIATGGTMRDDLLDNFETEFGADLIGCTIVRLRGLFHVTKATDNTDFVFAGIRVTQDSADMTNGLGPIAAEHADWMALQYFSLSNGGTAAAGRDGAAIHRVELDNKASRKLDELQQGLGLFVDHDSAGAIQFGYALSIGIKLP